MFSEKLGATDEEVADVPQMTPLARRVLREAFLAADMGISGVNFGVAETGSSASARTRATAACRRTLPRVHVALMGIERLVPTAADLGVMLQVLARSGTGQKLTVYTNIITGPRRPGEADGPEELHVVLVDNGRSDVLASELAEILYCIRCGACLNACPVYQQIGGHAYGSVYSGPVGAVLTPGARRHRRLARPAARQQSVRRVQGSVPGADRHSADAAALRAKGVEAGESPQWVTLGMKALGWIGNGPPLFRRAGRVAAGVGERRQRTAGSASCRSISGWTASAISRHGRRVVPRSLEEAARPNRRRPRS